MQKPTLNEAIRHAEQLIRQCRYNASTACTSVCETYDLTEEQEIELYKRFDLGD